MEKYVINLEYAKKLKELGVKQESEYKYFENSFGDFKGKLNLVKKDVYIKTLGDYYSAFMTDELLEIIPPSIIYEEEKYILIVNKNGFGYENYIVSYEINNTRKLDDLNVGIYEDEKLSNALAKMVIWLIENDYMEVNDE